MMAKSSPRVLIVDNDEGMVTAIAARLENEGYECITVGSGAQGYTVITEQNIDLVITDINMPMGNGISFANRIREISMIPIIFVTGFEQEFCTELEGIENYSLLTKPFDPINLLEIIEIDLTLSGNLDKG